MGRPSKELSVSDAEKLGMLGATHEEMAAWFDVSTRTIERRMSAETGVFCRAYKKGLGRLKVSLRRQQIEAAKKGNPTMLIWLGKQLLEQRDKIETKNDTTVRAGEPVKLTARDEEFLRKKAEVVGRMG